MILTLLNFNEVHLDIERQEFLEIVNAFVNKNKRKYKKFLKQQKGVVS